MEFLILHNEDHSNSYVLEGCIFQQDDGYPNFVDAFRISIDFTLLFLDDDNYDLSLRKSDSEGEEDTSEQDEKRRLERLEREKWIKG